MHSDIIEVKKWNVRCHGLKNLCGSREYVVMYFTPDDGRTEPHYDVKCNVCGQRLNVWQHELDAIKGS